MKNYSEIKPLKYKELNKISAKTLEIHHDKLYVGYVNKWKEIQEKLASADKEKANATYSEYRALKAEESYAANGVILHEAYFDVLGGDGKAKGEIIEKIKEDFGSYDNWVADLKACGMSARGWAIMAYDFNDGKLHNYTGELHNQGGIWGASPIIALDVYEHAYFIDFGSDRKSYIEAFFENLDWKAIDKKFKALKQN
ncbi:MAG: superoxide dismutase [Patescibacteria group bacterium]|nr:superoxide dismutase [Patescibacteria group bacterium]